MSLTAEQVRPISQAAIATILYFDVFAYPLTLQEIVDFSAMPGLKTADMELVLAKMTAEKALFKWGNFYSVRNDPSLEQRRLDCNQRADNTLPKARKIARLIGNFPFIRAVFVSGSLSKHSMLPDSDIDFFLITAPGRLWLARTLLVLFKKIFLFNSHKYFCVNYFIDTEHLSIQPRNLYAATETATLLPLYGAEWYPRFVAENQWTLEYLPQAPRRNTEQVPQSRTRGVKWLLEWIFAASWADRLDEKLMHGTLAFWRKKFQHLEKATFDHAFHSTRHVSRHHP
ncbi:MAG: nucleotidyltransferase domain-containing protein [Lewinellaceae bacterium]|nr:nucleotidyltransferase domain-containing protein [Lewinellaceae bacterium]